MKGTPVVELTAFVQKSKYEGAIAKIGQLGAEVHYPIDLPEVEKDSKYKHEGENAINALVCKLNPQ